MRRINNKSDSLCIENPFVSDSDYGAGEADGGYNNGEMRDLKRRYGARGDSKPMVKAGQWMRSKLAQQ